MEAPTTEFLRDVLHDSADYIAQEGMISLELKPLWGVILMNQLPHPRVSA